MGVHLPACLWWLCVFFLRNLEVSYILFIYIYLRFAERFHWARVPHSWCTVSSSSPSLLGGCGVSRYNSHPRCHPLASECPTGVASRCLASYRCLCFTLLYPFCRRTRIRSPSESKTNQYQNGGTLPRPIRPIWAQHDRLRRSQKKTITVELGQRALRETGREERNPRQVQQGLTSVYVIIEEVQST
jgi:hypothetical protein